VEEERECSAGIPLSTWRFEKRKQVALRARRRKKVTLQGKLKKFATSK